MAIRYICEPIAADQIRASLKDLPDGLSSIYSTLFAKVRQERPRDRALATRTISWLLSALVTLKSKEFITAVSSNYENHQVKVTKDTIIAACHHLVIFNESSDTFGFGHSSVVEYIQDYEQIEFGEAESKNLLAYLCLNAVYHVTQLITNELKTENLSRRQYLKRISDDMRLDAHANKVLTSMTQQGSVNSGYDFDLLPWQNTLAPSTFLAYATEYWAFHCQKSGLEHQSPFLWEDTLQAWVACNNALLIPQLTGRGVPPAFVDDVYDQISYRLHACGCDISETSRKKLLFISCK